MPIFAFFGYRKLVRFLKIDVKGAQRNNIAMTWVRMQGGFCLN